MQLEIQEVARILGSKASLRPALCRGYTSDSRHTRAGELFFAIPGPRFDGHDFVASAIESGAVGAVVSNRRVGSYSESLRPVLLDVPDTVHALQRLGQAVRRKWARPLVGVTGSTGKTTTKEMIAVLLGLCLRVAKSRGNLNNELGVPLSLVALEDDHEVGVMELAMSHAGEIRFLAGLAEPNVGVVTNVAPVHLEFFESLDAIAQAKRELVEELNPRGVLILNADDGRVREFGGSYPGKVVTFGLEADADYRASNLESATGGSVNFELVAEGNAMRMTLPLPGAHNVSNLLAAIAVARQFEIALEELPSALENLGPLSQRSEILNLPGGITLINDCYNSNPRALEEMLHVLGTWPSAGRRILVAGEMLELGGTAPEWHRKLGETAARLGRVDWLLGVRGEAQHFIEGAREGGLPNAQTLFFETAEEAAELLPSLAQTGDTVLIKGSRDVHLEKVVERMQAQGSESATG